jgi:hypothetical protein
MKTPMELFGAEIMKGWEPLVVELDAVLKAINPDFEYMQIKEKFGLLRAYVAFGDSYTDEQCEQALAAIDAAEAKSGSICEMCGEPGTLGGEDWLKTLCPAHRVEKENRYE